MSQTNRVISYSLFGYGKITPNNCFEFNSYLRGLTLNIRLAHLLYPNWRIALHVDTATYNAFKCLFNELELVIEVCDDAELTKAMLWRLKPCFQQYDVVLCRDLDSPLTYLEAQAVQYWINKESKACHAITDSISHNIPMLGGMIGFRPNLFRATVNFQSWEEMIASYSVNWNIKGSDQNFLNAKIYPLFSQPSLDSITQHYLKGMPNTHLSDFHNTVDDIEIPNVPPSMRASNDVCGHIGSAGWYETAMFKFLRQYWHLFDIILEAEKKHGKIFYWCNE